jgi:hypothetical protein
MIPPLFGKQEVGIWRVKKGFPRYGVSIWSLWPNTRFLPSIVAEKNVTKNRHIQNVFSMCIKINKVGKQEVGIGWVQKRFPRYGVPIWSLWPNIRSLPSILAEKNMTKNVHIQGFQSFYNRRYFLNFRRYLKNYAEGCKGSRGRKLLKSSILWTKKCTSETAKY